jgi:hypothetical protein
MQKRIWFGAILAFMFAAMGSQDVLAQDTPKVELGAQYSLIRFRDLDTTDSGFGGRLTFNATSNFALEAEINYFPSDKDGIFEGGRKTQGLFGVKTGVRSESAGIFGKLRPGFVHFSRDLDGIENGRTEFAIDIGGVIEFYPSTNSVVRFDLGDTIVRFGDRVTTLGPIDSFTSHNFQFSVGVGVRF